MCASSPLPLLLFLWAGASLASPGAPPQTAPSPPAAAPALPTVVLLDLEGNQAGQELAAGVGSLLASELAESSRLKLITQRDVTTLLGLEQQQKIFGEVKGCGDVCVAELSGALGARYVISGRLDRFGKTFVLTTTLVDALTATVLAKPYANAADDADLPAATLQVVRELLAKLPRPPGTPEFPALDEGADQRGAVLALKFGTSFISSLGSVSPAGDFEVGYRFHPEWAAFVQIGVTLVKAEGESGLSGINVVPSVLGVRHLYHVSDSFLPYWGLGLGIQLAFGEFGIFTRTGVLPTIVGLGGLEYLPTRNFGVVLEAKTNVARAVLGLAGAGLGSGLNLDLSLGVIYRL